MLIYTTDIIGGTQAGFGSLRAGAPKSAPKYSQYDLF